MKDLELAAIKYYGLEKDKKENTPRWRSMESSVKRLAAFFREYLSETQPDKVVGNPDVHKQVGK
jgi:hypothetical protein